MKPTGTLKPVPPVDPIPTVIPHPVEFQKFTHDGQRALWVGFVVMVVSAAVFSLMSWNVPIQRRLYHVIATTITIVAAVSYFSMATEHSLTAVCRTVVDHHKNKVPDTYHDVCRSVFWSRYVDWAITTPLLFVNLSLVAGASGGSTIIAAAAGLLTALAGWFSAYGDNEGLQTWGWFVISCLSYLVAIWHIALHGSASVKRKGSGAKKLFTGLSILTLAVFVVYIVVWGTANGCRQMTVDTEIITYVVLDILAKVVFGFWLLSAHLSVPDTHVHVGGYWAHGLTSEGHIRLPTDDEDV